MSLPEIKYCPGTLAEGFDTYSITCLKKVFNGRKVSHILPYCSPSSNMDSDALFDDSRKHISISGVQEKYSVILEKNKLRLANEGERGNYILKPIPSYGNKVDQMPANEHLTMQIARQAFGIDIAENALVFFENGEPAYITKRFDIKDDGSKWAQEDFASLAEKTPQTDGSQYKYTGNYLDLFVLMKKYVPAYPIEALKLFKLLMFNYLFSNGDAHLKNFSLLETPMGDFRMSPAYDLLNSRIHVADTDFALEDGLLPRNLAQGTVIKQFYILANQADLNEEQVNKIFGSLTGNSNKVEQLIRASFLSDKTKRSYLQYYQARLKRLVK
ncbi:HipA domain-containing protein [Halosquirtibacter laminarini]|uniref:HipA domain-containing protein n=1 Tax=Halosquirtibacter laminarini TaxID=3374600 RepID=A0AC61NE24_9BACT|nr:HipA domain-containing protein [Prolixibacteraceae bacterium]